MWIVPPTVSHGWTGHVDQAAEVVVFQFSDIPDLLANYVNEQEVWSVPLSEQDRQNLQQASQLAVRCLKISKCAQSILLSAHHARRELNGYDSYSEPCHAGTDRTSIIARECGNGVVS